LEWESLGTGWHIAAAQLAGDYEQLGVADLDAESHGQSMAYKRRKCNGGNLLLWAGWLGVEHELMVALPREPTTRGGMVT